MEGYWEERQLTYDELKPKKKEKKKNRIFSPGIYDILK